LTESMDWKTIVVGVDGSPESAVAAHVGWTVASRAGAACRLVHAVTPGSLPPLDIPTEVLAWDELVTRVTKSVQRLVRDQLKGNVPPRVLADCEVEVRFGKSTWALSEAVHEHEASLLVLGGKHHSQLDRLLGGRTAHHAVRIIDVPVLITDRVRQFGRVLVGLDLSRAALPTLRAAERFAALFGGALRVVHAVEPVPRVVELSFDSQTWDYRAQAEQQFRHLVSGILSDAQAEVVTRVGGARTVLEEECRTWEADVLVVGSHGRGWVHRVMIGSTTHRLLEDLPTSVLVVPVAEGDEASTPPREQEPRPAS